MVRSWRGSTSAQELATPGKLGAVTSGAIGAQENRHRARASTNAAGHQQDGHRGQRDRALLLLAWSGGGRRGSEVLNLQISDVRQ